MFRPGTTDESSLGEVIPRSSIFLITNEVTDETPEIVLALFTDEVTTEVESVSLR